MLFSFTCDLRMILRAAALEEVGKQYDLIILQYHDSWCLLNNQNFIHTICENLPCKMSYSLNIT